jgi:squalene-associated FAD-dependent desaturase
MSASNGKATVIVGGGFAGLSAAVRLADRGKKVIVLEATKAAGGRARSLQDTVTGREIDNGQHLMMGCYRETQAFLRAVGSDPDGIYYQHDLAVDMVKPGGEMVRLKCPALPAPLHLAAGLLRMKGIGVFHRLAALRAGLLLRGEIERPDDNETCDAWLRRMGQTGAMRNAFWEPLIWATLNDDPLIASAAMLVAVLDRAFMGTRDASRLGVPRVPLSRLYVDHAIEHLEAKGSEVRLGARATGFEMGDNRIRGVRLKGGETVDADQVISAVTPNVFLELLPERVREHVVFKDVARLEMSPIVNLWIGAERALFDLPFVGLVGSPVHWIWDRNKIERIGGGALLTVTISGARSFINDSSENLRELFLSECRRYFPDRRLDITAFRVVKEKRATISHAVGTYQRRPETVSPIRGLYMAGDWVRTGLPATIESACQSGHDAAKAVLEERMPRRVSEA